MPASIGGDVGVDGPLEKLVNKIERAFDSRDFERTAQLIEEDFLAAWFGMHPTRFVQIIRTLAPVLQESAFMQIVAPMFLEASGAGSVDVNAEESIEGTELSPRGGAITDGSQMSSAMLMTRAFQMRLEGRPREAYEFLQAMSADNGTIQTLFDDSKGWGLFLAVQRGVTAMLAGEFTEALVSFTKAKMYHAQPELSFLVRDAMAKSALVEALYGSQDRAIKLLEKADEIERTTSWAELHIDSAYTIAASRVRAQTPEASLEMLDAIPLRDLGEVWPFFVHAVQASLSALGRTDEAANRIALFAQLPLPHVDGNGYSGSALPLAAAANFALQGDSKSAREQLERADQSIVTARLLRAMFDASAGLTKHALQQLGELRELTKDLRLMDTWRLAAMASCYFNLGAERECTEVLVHLVSRPGGVGERERHLFTDEINDLAERNCEAWPRRSWSKQGFSDFISADQESLTEQEIQALRALASGLSREQIASAQFISVNTLKTHLRSVYRKLGVKSRNAAVLEGERRGLL